MGDYDITQDEGPNEPFHGDWYASWHVDRPKTVKAVRSLLARFPQDNDPLLVSIHGVPKRGSKNDIGWKDGDHRVYSKYVSRSTLERYVQQNIPDLVRARYLEEHPDAPRDKASYQAFMSELRLASALEFANRFFREWGFVEVDGITIAYLPEME